MTFALPADSVNVALNKLANMPDYVSVDERLPSRLRRRNREYLAELTKEKRADPQNAKTFGKQPLSREVGHGGTSDAQYCDNVTRELEIEEFRADDSQPPAGQLSDQ